MPLKVYDSEDPHLPNLPDREDLAWSDYEYLEDDSSSGSSIDSGETYESAYASSVGPTTIASKRNKAHRRTVSSSKRPSILSNIFGSHRRRSTDNSSLHRRPTRLHDLFSESNFELEDDESPVINDSNEKAPPILQPSTEHDQAAGDPYAGLRARFVDDLKTAPETQSKPAPSKPASQIPTAASAMFNAAFPGKLSGRKLFQRKDPDLKRGERRYNGSKSKKERAAWEPGVDVHTMNVLLNTPGSTVTITDYNKDRYRVQRYELYSEMDNDVTRTADQDGEVRVQFSAANDASSTSSMESDDPEMDRIYQSITQYMTEVEHSKSELKSALQKRPDWGKVRWINVNGLSWEAISIIGDYYSLHPLAIEDMVDIPQRTKVDVYPTHLFCVMPLLKLVAIKLRLPNRSSSLFGKRASFVSEHVQPTTLTADTDGKIASKPSKSKFKSLNEKIMDDPNARTLTNSGVVNMEKDSSGYRKLKEIELRRPLYRRKLGVGEEQLSIFLTLDGTVISFFEHSANDMEKAVLPRLASEYTLLRSSEDPSILFESVLDASVDMVYPIVTAYSRVLSEFEVDILTSPDMSSTPELHLTVNELTLLRSTIQPVSAVVAQLKDQGLFKKFLSADSTLYLSDINDHLLCYMQDIDSMVRTSENLVSLVFNTLSVETNTSMQRLSFVTVLFLPLTFWTGYYGMNFEKFADLSRSVGSYWIISVPFCTVFLVFLMRKEIVRFMQQSWDQYKERKREASR